MAGLPKAPGGGRLRVVLQMLVKEELLNLQYLLLCPGLLAGCEGSHCITGAGVGTEGVVACGWS